MENQILDEGVFEHQSAVTLKNVERLLEAKKELKDAENGINYGRYAIGVLIVMQFIATIMEGQQYDYDTLITSLNLGMAGVYIGALVLSFKYPKLGFIIASVMFGLILIIAIIGDPMQLIKGIIIKVLVCYYLFSAIGKAGKFESLKKELAQLGYKSSV